MTLAINIILKILKYLGYLILGVLALVVVILLVVNFLLRSPSFNDYILAKVLPGVGESLGADIQVEKLRIGLIPTSILVQGAHFTPATGEFKHKFVSVDQLFLDVKTTALFSGRAVVEKLEIKGLNTYMLRKDGKFANLPSSGKEKEKKEKKDSGPLELKYPVVVEDFRVENSFFIYEDADAKMEAGIMDIFIGLAASLETGEAEANVALKDGYFRQGKIDQKLESISIDASADLHQWTAKVNKLAIRIPGITVDATADAANLIGELTAHADLTVGVDASIAKDFVAQPKLSGDITVETAVDFGLPKSGMTYGVDGKLALKNIKVNELPVNLATDFYVDTKALEVKGLAGNVGTGAVNIYAKLGMDGGKDLTSTVKITDLDVGDAAGKYGVTLPMSGSLDVDIEAQGKLAKPTGAKDKEGKPKTEMALSAKGNVGLNSFEMGKGKDRIVAIPKIAVDLDAGYFGTLAKINSLTVKTAKSTIDVSGTYNTKGPMDIKAELALDDLSEFSPVTGKKVGGKGTLKATAKGTAKNPKVSASLNFDKLLFDSFAVDEIAGTLGMDGKIAKVESLTVRTKESQVKVEASADLGKPMKVQAKIKIPTGKIEDFLVLAGKPDLDVKGVINLDVDVDGPVDNLTGVAKLNINEVKAFGENVKSIAMDSNFADGFVYLNDLRIVKMTPPRKDIRARKDDFFKEAPKDQWVEGVIAAKGKFNPKSGEIDLKLRTQNLSEASSDTVRKKAMPLWAQLSIAADVSGNIKDPEVKAKVEVLKARYGDYILGDTVINATIEKQVANVNAQVLANRWTEKILPAKEGWVVIHTDKKSRKKKEKPNKQDLEMEKAEDFTEAVDTETLITETGEFGAISLDLSANLKDDQQVKGALVFDKFDYSGFLIALRDEEPKKKRDKEKVQSLVEGQLNGKVDISGSLKDTAGMLIDANLDQVYFRKNGFILNAADKNGNPAPLLVTVQGGKIDIRQFKLGGTGIQLSIDQGTVAGRNGFVLDGDIDLGIIKEFTTLLAESEGKLIIKGGIPADFKVPDAFADISISKGLFDVQKSPTAVEDFQFAATFRNGTAKITRMKANIGGGTLKGEGNVVLDLSGAKKPKPPNIDLVVKIRNVKTGFDPYLEAGVKKVDIFVTDRPKGGMNVSGEVVIDKAVYSQDIDFLTILKSFDQPKTTSGSQTYKEATENLFFNVAIRADEGVAFQNNFADIEAKMDLLFTGSNVAPALLGNVEIIKGRAEVLKNNFKVTRGVITFLDEDRIFPNFDINVETPVDDTLVFVVVSGNPTNVKFSFSSDPPMSERDIITLLALGVSYEEFQAQESGISGDEAAALAAQQLLGSQLKGITGDSGIEISVDSAAGVPRFKVRTEIEKDLYFSIFRGITEPTLGAELEYAFLRNLSLLGDWDNLEGYEDATPMGAFGVGVKLKIEFK